MPTMEVALSTSKALVVSTFPREMTNNIRKTRKAKHDTWMMI